MSEKDGCLICGNPSKARGLCMKHYVAFNRTKKGLPEDQQQDFDDLMVAEGKINPANEQEPNPFAEAAERFRISRNVDEMVDKAHKQVAEHVAKYVKKKPAKKKGPPKS